VRKILYLVVLSVIFLLHLSYVPNGFTWLDHRDIESGHALVPLETLPHVLFTQFGDTGFYRPLVSMTLSLDNALYAGSAWGFHLTNVLLHMVVIILVPLFLACFFSFSFFEILLILFIVGVHPLGWLPVGAISYRAELLLTMFIFLTVYFHAEARKKSSSLYEFLAIISLFLGFLCKETAFIIIPAVIIFWEILWSKKKGKRVKIVTQLHVAEAVVMGLYLFLRFQAVPDVWRVNGYPLQWVEWIGTRMVVLGELLLQFISPLKPDLSDAVAVHAWNNPVILVCIVMIGTCLVIIKRTGIYSAWSRTLLLFFIFLTPALGIIPVPRLGSPHYGYIALATFGAIIVLGIRLVRKKPVAARISLYVVCIFWLLTMCITTFVSGSRYRNDATVFAPEVERDPHFLEGYFYLGNYYLSNDELSLAESAYGEALRTSPEYIAYSEKQSVLMNLAITKARRGKFAEAEKILKEAERYATPEEKKMIEHNKKIMKSEKVRGPIR
jgi:hypothetical protein